MLHNAARYNEKGIACMKYLVKQRIDVAAKNNAGVCFVMLAVCFECLCAWVGECQLHCIEDMTR